ncbi:Ribonuclease H-like domain,Integrase, catalytic core,Chromo/chromo shadow domain [Cinara cedri]|uniref:Ribonuclease H-like domain,Integrase, catalytic core,Chromo/chromo shadow domain n=1 Tax=Cinara cedri TaxID=506608 RepID=A0A5E4NKU1_9HEMI|nr:Ribonuclease H-like domain,Integrase, catalytic core,Chromo/chromo shadow domain [Cinara cedri]
MSKRDIALDLHKPVRRNYIRRTVNVYDCFTKYVWAVPLKSKTGKEVTKAMSDILTYRSPMLLQLDNGKEFYNLSFDTLMAKHNVKKYSTFSTTKAFIVERFNRTLKGNMFRAFTANGSREWVSILPQLIEKYISSKHRTTGMTPIQADQNPSSVMLNQRSIPVRKKKFIVGDKVRVSVNKGVFTKGYLPNWSTEVFTVVKINNTLPFTYRLEDYKGNPIIGCFYTEEINKTSFPHDYLVEKIVRRNGDRILVKWLGFDSLHNS